MKKYYDEEVGSRELDDDTLASYHRNSLTTAQEELNCIIASGENGRKRSVRSGDDTPFAVLSSQPRIIYDYFRQQLPR
ncbi:glutamate synthase central domain-containing protein [Escherichia coli]